MEPSVHESDSHWHIFLNSNKLTNIRFNNIKYSQILSFNYKINVFFCREVETENTLVPSREGNIYINKLSIECYYTSGVSKKRECQYRVRAKIMRVRVMIETQILGRVRCACTPRDYTRICFVQIST